MLTPIEENEEYEDDEDNQPITMGKCRCLWTFYSKVETLLKLYFSTVPKIVQTAPSPLSENPPSLKNELTQKESVL